MRKGNVIGWILCCILAVNTLLMNIAYAEQKQEGMKISYDGKEHYYTAQPVSLIVDGDRIDTVMPPIILEGRALVPAREVFSPLGAVVEWKPDTREIFVGMEDILIILQIDNKNAWINGVIHELDMPPKIITSTQSKTMIPARFVAETLGFYVNWDNENRLVEIKKPEIKIPEYPAVDGNILVAWQGDESQTIRQNLVESQITAQNSPIVDITDVILPTSPTGEQVFTIQASGAISDVKTAMLEDNRLMVDVINSNWKLKASISVQNNSFLNRIRSSQNQIAPQMITRVVFDLNGTYPVNVSLTPDRKNIVIQIQKNTITRLEVEQNQLGEQVKITGVQTPSVSIARMSSPERLVIDMPNTTSLLNTKESAVQGNFIGVIRTSQFDQNTTRVVLELKQQVEYQAIIQEGNIVGIQLFPANETIQFTNQGRTQLVIRKHPQYPISAAQIIQEDLYISKMYKFILPGDYSALYGQRVMQLGNSQVDAVTIQNNGNNQTELLIHQKQIFAYNITEDASNIYIHLVPPREKYKQIVVVDAGHGAHDPGAQANGLVEKTLNLDISLRLQQFLEKDPNIKVYMTRTTDVFLELADRAKIANEIGADLFISVHNNAYTASTKGTETYYADLPIKNEPSVTSTQAAQIFQDNLVKKLGTVDRKIRKKNDFAVLRLTTMPAVLLEIGYMTNTDDAKKLGSPEFRQKAAEAIYESIQQIFERYPTVR